MDLKEIIKKRVSTREYSIEPVNHNLIEDLIDCARLAPSAANRQPWHFVIVENEEKNHIAQILLKEYQKEKEVENNFPTTEYNPAKSLINSIRIINEAPVLILVFREDNPNWLEGDYLSIGCAVEHICLRATELGLGTLWVRDVIYKRKEITKYLGKDKMQLVTGITVGYSTEYPYERKKKDLNEIMQWFHTNN